MRILMALALLSPACKKTPAPPVVDPEPVAATPATPSEQLEAFFAEVHRQHLDNHPIEAAYLGLPHDDTTWGTMSGEAWFEARLADNRRWLEELDALPLDALGPEDQLSVALFRRDREREIEGHRWRYHGLRLTQISGTHTWGPSFLMTVHRIEDLKTAESFMARTRDFARVLDEVRVHAERQAEMGIRAPAYAYPQMIASIDNLTTGAPFTEGGPSPLLAHFESRITEIGQGESVMTDMSEIYADILRDELGPAYARLRAFLDEDAVNAVEKGAWSFPDGAEYYAFELRGATTTDRTPDEIHELGLAEVARIQDEMRSRMADLGVEGDLQDLYTHLREDPRYTLSDDDEGREAYLDLARGYVTGIEAVLPEYFEHLPEQPLEVWRVEEWREESAGKAFYQSPSPDGSRPGIFYANLAHMENMPVYQLESLVYHEGIPGHHMQNAVSQKLDDLPAFRRFGHYTAYGEGWGLYSERLPKELGFYEDPASDVGRLAAELWRAARLVVDTGLHHHQWTREQAIEYLVTETPNPRGDAVRAVERYMVWPGQATAYKVGMLEILRMREEAREALGDDFDLRGFHGVVLGTGPVPLDVLDGQVDAWVAERQAARSAR